MSPLSQNDHNKIQDLEREIGALGASRDEAMELADKLHSIKTAVPDAMLEVLTVERALLRRALKLSREIELLQPQVNEQVNQIIATADQREKGGVGDAIH